MRKNKAGFSEIIFIVIIVVLVGTVGFFVYQNNQLKQNIPEPVVEKTTQADETSSPTESSIPEVDPTVGWETYTTDRISFKYPGNITVDERQPNYLVLLLDPDDPQSIVASIDARLLEDLYSNYSEALISAKSRLTNIEINEANDWMQISGKVGSGYREGTPITIALFQYQQGVIEAETTTTSSANLLLFDQILSTFKFTE